MCAGITCPVTAFGSLVQAFSSALDHHSCTGSEGRLFDILLSQVFGLEWRQALNVVSHSPQRVRILLTAFTSVSVTGKPLHVPMGWEILDGKQWVASHPLYLGQDCPPQFSSEVGDGET